MMEIRCENEKKKGIGTHEYPGNVGVVLTPATRSRLLIPPPPYLPPYLPPTYPPGPSVPTHPCCRGRRETYSLTDTTHHRLSGKGRPPQTVRHTNLFFHTYTKAQHATPPPTPFPHLGPPPTRHHPPPCLV